MSVWLDRFFQSYYLHRPVNATFIGIRTYDGRLPDLSESGIEDTMTEMQTLLTQSSDLPVKEASPVERLDLRMARGFLKIQSWEYGSRHFHRGNPSLYTGEAVFGVMSLFLNHSGSLTERIDSAINRMEAIPGFFAHAKHNVTSAPALWIERAIRECDGALVFLTSGVQMLVADQGISEPGFLKAAETAASGFRQFRKYLTSELCCTPAETASCGEEAMAMYLEEGHFLDETGNEILSYAESELAEVSAYLAEHASDFGARNSAEVLAQLSSITPSVESYLEHYQELWDQVRKTALDQELLSWPDFPIRYIPRPGWFQDASSLLYFLPYRSPAAFDRPLVHDHLVAPIDASMSSAVQGMLLAANNTTVIKLNHVIHHGSIGHHVQNWYAFQASSRVGQVAAVDCAARVAMFCGGTTAEGWACYATDLMKGVGFLSPVDQYAEKVSRLRMCARTIVDIRLHQGRISLDQAVEFYEQKVGMSPDTAKSEAVKNSMFPGTAVIYLVGTDGIHRLRREMVDRRGAEFVLKDFHDEFRSHGSFPVALIAEAMQGTKDIQISEEAQSSEFEH